MRVAGIMSGTSLDGIDVAVVDIEWPSIKLVAFSSTPYPNALRKRILAVSNTDCHTRDIARLHYELGFQYATAVAAMKIKGIQLVGCHGQTIYHEGQRCTLQIGEGAVIAEQLRLPIDLVRDVTRKVDRNEYKRQQAAPGIKVTTKAFGIGRRYPIAQRYRE